MQMHPLTLQFADGSLEAHFRLRSAAATVHVGMGMNLTVCVLHLAAFAQTQTARDRDPCEARWPHLLPWAIASLGALSNACIGRLGKPSLEHWLLVRSGVANVLCGTAALIMFTQYAVQLPAGTCGQPSLPVYSPTEAMWIFATIVGIALAQHMLAFDFWARVVINVAMGLAGMFSPALTPFPLASQAALTWLSIAAGELPGYYIQRSMRLRYIRARQAEGYSQDAPLSTVL